MRSSGSCHAIPEIGVNTVGGRTYAIGDSILTLVAGRSLSGGSNQGMPAFVLTTGATLTAYAGGVVKLSLGFDQSSGVCHAIPEMPTGAVNAGCPYPGGESIGASRRNVVSPTRKLQVE